MLPRDFVSGPPSDADRVIVFCGGCTHFEVWALGGGGDCHLGHDTHAQAAADFCGDRHLSARGSGPLFDLSE